MEAKTTYASDRIDVAAYNGLHKIEQRNHSRKARYVVAQKFYEIEISRTIYTTVTICIDEDDEVFKHLFSDGDKQYPSFASLQDAVHNAANELTKDYEWETDDVNTEVVSLKEIPKEEAIIYSVWDAKNNRKYVKPATPTPQESNPAT